MKTILFDIRSLFNNTFSGVQEYTLNLLHHLLKIDQENQYLLLLSGAKQNFPQADSPLKKLQKKMLSSLLEYPNVELKEIALPNKLLNSAFTFLNFPPLDKLIQQKIDLFFFPNLIFFTLSKHIPYLIVFHDLSFEVDHSFFSYQMRLWHKIINPLKKAREAQMIISVSENTKRDLVNFYGIKEEKIKVIYPGINLSHPHPSPPLQAVQRKYNLPPHFILYLGTLEPRKNIIGIIQGFEILKNQKKREKKHQTLKLVIAGQCGWQCYKIYQTAKKSKYAQDIVFTGFVREEDKATLYQMAQAFIYPSLYEGFGFPPLEALACHTPSLVSYNSSLPEIIGEAALLVDPYNPREIAEGIKVLLEEEEVRKKNLKKRREVLNKYSWEKSAQAIYQIITD